MAYVMKVTQTHCEFDHVLAAINCINGPSDIPQISASLSPQRWESKCVGWVLLRVAILLSLWLSFGGASIVYAASEDEVARMALPGEKCRIGSAYIPSSWTVPEKWAWGEICEGRSADFNKLLNETLYPKLFDDEKRSDGRRAIGSRFLKTILLYEPFRSATPFRAVTIIGTKSCAKAFTRVVLQRHRAAPDTDRTWAWRCSASCISG